MAASKLKRAGKPNVKARRNAQNMRTFENVKKRRERHKKMAPNCVSLKRAKRWTSPPSPKK